MWISIEPTGKKRIECKQKGFEDVIYAHVAAHLYFEPGHVGKITDSLDFIDKFKIYCVLTGSCLCEFYKLLCSQTQLNGA